MHNVWLMPQVWKELEHRALVSPPLPPPSLSLSLFLMGMLLYDYKGGSPLYNPASGVALASGHCQRYVSKNIHFVSVNDDSVSWQAKPLISTLCHRQNSLMPSKSSLLLERRMGNPTSTHLLACRRGIHIRMPC